MTENKTFPENILTYPDLIKIKFYSKSSDEIAEETIPSPLQPFEALSTATSQNIQKNDITLSFEKTGETLDLFITAKETPLSFVKLEWKRPMPKTAKVYGDTWERGYGDLEWSDIADKQNKFMPWYFFLNSENKTTGFGVMVRPSALCYWEINESGISLYADIQNGSQPVHLNGRVLKIASIVNRQYINCSAFEACQSFCKLMCKDPIFPKEPVYGSNNWYYAYGDSSEEEILSDTDYIISLTKGIKNRPYMVIDDCWQEHHRLNEYNGGPWTKGNKKFPDMKKLAEKIKEKGAKVGIWFRPLQNESATIPDSWRLPFNGCLDPSRQEVLRYVKADITRICEWGFSLIKHDFSTFDITGNWGFQMLPLMCKPEVTFYDKTKTTAEIITNFYAAIYEAAKKYDAVILGCNTIGHLGAGLMQMNRSGDDTSGKDWEITKKMGINTLAFRLMQHKTFYDIDADCVGILGAIPWKYNKQWTQLLAISGTPLFISAKPSVMTEEEKQEMYHYLEISSKQNITAIMSDWMENPRPTIWKTKEKHLGEGANLEKEKTYHYNWD